MCYGDFGRDGAGPGTCGHGASGGGCGLGDTLAEEMLRVTELVVRVVRVASLCVAF
jgi:hypothetical protein